MTQPDPQRIKEIRRIIGEVRRILLEDWDPLAVGGMPALADEYDFVLGRVFAALNGSPTVQSVVQALSDIERDCLGLPQPRPDLCVKAAERLVALRRVTKPWPSGSTESEVSPAQP